LKQIIGASSIVDWAEKNVDVTHIEKRKLKVGPRKDKGKRAKLMDEAVLRSDESTPEPG
jgi:hypothetical protein